MLLIRTTRFKPVVLCKHNSTNQNTANTIAGIRIPDRRVLGEREIVNNDSTALLLLTVLDVHPHLGQDDNTSSPGLEYSLLLLYTW